MRTTVVNLRREPYDVYIGRAGKGQDGYFGNPYRIGPNHSREAVLGLYRDYLYHRAANDSAFNSRLLELQGKVLGCFCKPEPCHGDIIAEWVDSQTYAADGREP